MYSPTPGAWCIVEYSTNTRKYQGRKKKKRKVEIKGEIGKGRRGKKE